MDRIKVILDTDMGSDCDDAGALSLLHKFAKEGKTAILNWLKAVMYLAKNWKKICIRGQ